MLAFFLPYLALVHAFPSNQNLHSTLRQSSQLVKGWRLADAFLLLGPLQLAKTLPSPTTEGLASLRTSLYLSTCSIDNARNSLQDWPPSPSSASASTKLQRQRRQLQLQDKLQKAQALSQSVLVTCAPVLAIPLKIDSIHNSSTTSTRPVFSANDQLAAQACRVEILRLLALCPLSAAAHYLLARAEYLLGSYHGVLQGAAGAIRLEHTQGNAAGQSSLAVAVGGSKEELAAKAYALLAFGAESLIPFPEGLELSERLYHSCYLRFPDAKGCARGSKAVGRTLDGWSKYQRFRPSGKFEEAARGLAAVVEGHGPFLPFASFYPCDLAYLTLRSQQHKGTRGGTLDLVRGREAADNVVRLCSKALQALSCPQAHPTLGGGTSSPPPPTATPEEVFLSDEEGEGEGAARPEEERQYLCVLVHTSRAWARYLRGRLDGARVDLDAALEVASSTGDRSSASDLLQDGGYRELQATMRLYPLPALLSPSFYTRLGFKKEDGRRADFAKSLKKAYRSLALIYHPDKSSDDPDYSLFFWKKIIEAYEVLSDDTLRSQYDAFGGDAKGLRIDLFNRDFDESDEEGEGDAGKEGLEGGKGKAQDHDTEFIFGGAQGENPPGGGAAGREGPSIISICGPKLRRCLPFH